MPVPPPLQVPALPAHVAALMPADKGVFNVGASIRHVAAAIERWLAALTPRRLLLLLCVVAFLAGPSRIASAAHGVVTLPLRPLAALAEWVDFATGSGLAADEVMATDYPYPAGAHGPAHGGAGSAGGADQATGPSAASLAAAESLRAAAAGASTSEYAAGSAADAGTGAGGGAGGAGAVGADELARATEMEFWMQAAGAANAAADPAAAAAAGAGGASLPALPVAPLAALLSRVAAMDRRIAAHYGVISDSLLPRLDGAEATANNAVKAAAAAGTAAEDASRRADAATAAAREASGTLAAAAAAVGAVAEQAAAVQAVKSDLSSLTADVTQLRAGHASSLGEVLAAVKAAQEQQATLAALVNSVEKSVAAADAAVRDVTSRVTTLTTLVQSVSAGGSAAGADTASAAPSLALLHNISTELATAATTAAAAQASAVAAVERIAALEGRAQALESKAAALAAGSAGSTAASTDVPGAAVIAADAGAVAALAAAVAELRQQTHAALTAAVGAAVATGAGRVRPSVQSWRALHTQFTQWRSASAAGGPAAGADAATAAAAGIDDLKLQQVTAIVASVLDLADSVEHGVRGPSTAGDIAALPLPVAVPAATAALAPLTAVTRVVSPSAVVDGYFGAWLNSLAASSSSFGAGAAASASELASIGDVAAMVNAAIAAYAADGVALPDYALASGGACVVTDAPAYALTSRTWSPAAAASSSALVMPGPRTALTVSHTACLVRSAQCSSFAVH